MNLEEKSIKFIQTINRSMPDLFAGNSGGKDSAVVDFLLQKSGIDFKSYYTNTTIDPPKTISHMRSYRDWETDRKSTRLNSSHRSLSRMPSSA